MQKCPKAGSTTKIPVISQSTVNHTIFDQKKSIKRSQLIINSPHSIFKLTLFYRQTHFIQFILISIYFRNHSITQMFINHFLITKSFNHIDLPPLPPHLLIQ